MSRLSDPMLRLSDFAAQEAQRHTPRERTLFYRELRAICRWSYRHAYACVLLSMLLCIPAFLQARKIGLDTDLTRLLPESSPAVQWSDELEPLVGDGGFFSVIVEDAELPVMRRAVDDLAAGFAEIDGLDWIDYRYPTEFLDQHRYMLIPSQRLDEMIGVVGEWEAQVNPFIDDLGLGGDDAEDGEPDSSDLERVLVYYQDLPLYHEDPDGRMIGMLITASRGLSNLGSVQQIYRDMQAVAAGVEDSRGVRVSIGGSLRTRVEEFEVIIADVTRMGIISVIAILLTLGVSFGSFRVLPVVVYPLVAALLWAFAFVPSLVGDLNTITSFLLMVLFGMGVDYSIHLVKRFRHELVLRDPESALIETFTSTGRSVMTSALTTALGLLILVISQFRGFSDLGLIGGTSILVIMLAMLLVMPATLIVGYRLGMLRGREPRLPSRHFALPPRWAAAAVTVLVVVSGVAAIAYLEFDYDFSNFSANSEEIETIKAKQEEIYPLFFGPAAIYVAPDLPTLDAALAILEEARDQPRSRIASAASIRDFAPTQAEAQTRRELIDEIQEMLSARWTRRVEDPDRASVIADVRQFVPGDTTPRIDELPETISHNLVARDGSGGYVIAVGARGAPKDGRVTMEFTRQLYDMELPADVRGPTGDKPVLAEILWLVTEEAPRIVALTFLGILLLVIADRRSVRQAVWVLLPLVASLLMTFGAMIALGWKLNFFNIVVLPSLLGLGVDHGVHYYRRWRELGCHTALTQLELFEPITVATLTTIMGYAGMAFAHHPGLRSIGNLAIVGLTCTWITALVLLPGLLRWREFLRAAAARKSRQPAPAAATD